MKIYLKIKTKKGKMKIKKKLKDVDVELFGRECEPLRRVSTAVRIVNAVIRTILSAALVFCLSSCSVIPGYSEPEDRYIVSAMGFDMKEDTLAVSVQIVDGEETRVCTGKGESVWQAMAHIEGADAKQLEISHCALILMGDSLGASEIKEVFDYCRKNNDITVGAKVASTRDAFALLSLGADGYELLGAIRDSGDGLGFTGGSRFYEIEEKRSSQSAPVYHLPYFSSDGDIYTVSGLKIYRSDTPLVRLDSSESAYYMMIKGELVGGSVDYEMNGREESLFVRKCKTDYKTEGDKLYITCRLDATGNETEKAAEACTDRAQRLCQELTERYGDIFGLSIEGETVVKCIAEKERGK